MTEGGDTLQASYSGGEKIKVRKGRGKGNDSYSGKRVRPRLGLGAMG